jgi:A/G-specific adenine glycosylase
MIQSESSLEWEDLTGMDDFRALFPVAEPIHFRLVVNNQKHVLSHRILYANFYEVKIEKIPESFSNFIPVRKEEIDEYPIHRLMQIYLEKCG